MYKKIGLGLLCASVLISSSLMAAGEQGFLPHVFPKGVAKPINNIMGKKVTAFCSVVPNNEEIKLEFRGVEGSGSVNHVPVVGTAVLPVTLHAGQTLCLEADKGSKVMVTNLGPQESVTANCTLVKGGQC